MIKLDNAESVLTVQIRTESMKEVTSMKSLWTKVVVILFVMGLTLFCAKAWAAEWKEFAEATTGTFYFDAASISSPSEGFIRVWIHNETKLKTHLIELNCKGKIYKVLDSVEYDEADRIKARDANYDNPNFSTIAPDSVPELLHSILCP